MLNSFRQCSITPLCLDLRAGDVSLCRIMTVPTSQFKKRILVTAALPYPNGRPHVGHVAGAYIPADIFVRFMRLRGHDVRFICGSDDHGAAIVISSLKEGTTPREFASRFHDLQAKDFAGLGIEFDVYGATSQNKFHNTLSQDLFLKIYEKGCFEKQRSRQFYDETRSMFLPDRFVKGTCALCGAADQNGDQCENCGKILEVEDLKDPISVISGSPAVIKETVHWFLDLSRFQAEVERWMESAELRDHTRNYVKGLLSTGLVKRSMTRDLDWGVPVPLDDPEAKDKVLYVWFDAPIGYISNTMEVCETREGNPEVFADWWKSKDTDVIHFIGEDNTIFHCVIWIAMLSAEGSYSLPRAVVVNQFLNFQKEGDTEAQKISKSRGIGVFIGDYLEGGGSADVMRYYLTAVAPESARSVYNPADLVARLNADLANTIGNFVNRILSFSLKHAGPGVPEFFAEKVTETDRAFLVRLKEAHTEIASLIESYSFKAALERLMVFARECNKYADEKAPWTSRKTDMELTKTTLWHAIQAIHFLGTTLTPFMPGTAAKIRAMIGLAGAAKSWDEAVEFLAVGQQLGTPEILFQKVE